MKRPSFVVFIFITLTLSFIVTGFQCGSTDMTSAKLYLQRNDYALAATSLEKEVSKNPTNAEAWYYLGFCQLNLKKFDAMLPSFDASLKAGKEFADKIQLAKLSAWGQLFNMGIAKHNEITKVQDDQAKVASLAKEALGLYQLAVQCVPDSPATYQNIAAVYAVTKQFDEEIVNLKKVRDITKDPALNREIINAFLLKAEDAKAKGDNATADASFNSAIEELRAARTADPDNLELLSLLIDVHIQLKREKEALPFIQEAVKKDPSNKILQNNLGLLLMQTEDINGAIEHFNAALAVDQNFEDALRNIGVAYMRLGDIKKKEAEAKADPKKKDKDIDKSYLEHFKKAAEHLDKLVKIKSDDANLWDALTTAYVNAGMIKEAQKAAAEADKLRKK
ncbi:MAG: tetratricopeptide repeat protein [Ignavibacteriae bacterium]|nr:tetratricopeptide repeat protein [Ignavibacteriota bacterium]